MNEDKYDVNGNVIDDVDDTNLGKEVRFFKGWVKGIAILFLVKAVFIFFMWL